jgi:hypothetical protein
LCHWLAACFWLAAATATHQSSVLFVAFLVPNLFDECASLTRRLRDVLFLLAFGLLVAGPYELWSIRAFSLEAKLSHNPAVMYTPAGANPVLVKLENLVTTLFGDPFGVLNHATSVYGPLSLPFCVPFWFSWLAGTLLGTFGPFMVYPSLWRHLFLLRSTRDAARPMVVASIVVVLSNAMVNPYPGAHGLTQTGLVGLCLLLYWWIMSVLPSVTISTVIVFVTGTLPLFIWNGVWTSLCSLGLVEDIGNAQFRLMRETGLASVGIEFWPFSTLFGVGGLAIYFQLSRRFVAS